MVTTMHVPKFSQVKKLWISIFGVWDKLKFFRKKIFVSKIYWKLFQIKHLRKKRKHKILSLTPSFFFCSSTHTPHTIIVISQNKSLWSSFRCYCALDIAISLTHPTLVANFFHVPSNNFFPPFNVFLLYFFSVRIHVWYVNEYKTYDQYTIHTMSVTYKCVVLCTYIVRMYEVSLWFAKSHPLSSSHVSLAFFSWHVLIFLY